MAARLATLALIVGSVTGFLPVSLRTSQQPLHALRSRSQLPHVVPQQQLSHRGISPLAASVSTEDEALLEELRDVATRPFGSGGVRKIKARNGERTVVENSGGGKCGHDGSSGDC